MLILSSFLLLSSCALYFFILPYQPIPSKGDQTEPASLPPPETPLPQVEPLSHAQEWNQRAKDLFDAERYAEAFKVADGSMTVPEAIASLLLAAISVDGMVSTEEAVRIGGLLGKASEAQIQALAHYGMQIGLAFQIADDALDYCAVEENLGKSLGKDLSEGKITLPLIHLLSACTTEENEKTRGIIYADNHQESDLRYILDLMERHQSITYALGRAREIAREGAAALSVFEGSPELESFQAVAAYVVDREL